MPVAGRKSKPEGQAVHRNKPVHEWTEVPNVPHDAGPLAELPEAQPPWPIATQVWWRSLARMPHAVLWSESDWVFAMDTALVHAAFQKGDMRVAAEVRNREKILGTTMDFRRDLRIRYVDPPDEAEEPGAAVTKLDDYRDLYG